MERIVQGGPRDVRTSRINMCHRTVEAWYDTFTLWCTRVLSWRNIHHISGWIHVLCERNDLELRPIFGN